MLGKISTIERQYVKRNVSQLRIYVLHNYVTL